jgi:hypothetical protein
MAEYKNIIKRQSIKRGIVSIVLKIKDRKPKMISLGMDCTKKGGMANAI